MHPPSPGRLLASRLGRRMALYFVGCALGPVVAVATLGPVVGYRAALGIGVGLGLALGILASLVRTRCLALGMTELARATRRVAAGDLETPVPLGPRHDLADLAEAFTAMADGVEGRFFVQERASELDREILSSVDTASIAQAVLDLLPEVYSCRTLSLTVLDPQSENVATTWMEPGRGMGGGERKMVAAELSPADVAEALRHPEWMELGGEVPLPGYLAHLRVGGDDYQGVVACPLFQAGELVGVLAVRDDPGRRTDESLARLRRAADRVAVALSNARMMDQVRALALYDSLTRLPNRILYLERLGQAIGRAEPEGGRVAVCTLDLDHFGRINDTLGPALGDRLIAEVGTRLAEVCGPEGVGLGARVVSGWCEVRGVQLARLGGDEFAIVLPDLGDEEDALRMARRVVTALQHPFRLEAQEVFVTASVGIAAYPTDGGDRETLHQHANLALSHAKREGRNTIERYAPSMNGEALERMRLERELRRAVERGEFTMWYQPVVDLRTRWATGAEALVRWDHPERGLVSPGEFMQLCEESGVIVPLGEWSLWTVCTQARRWAEAGFTGLQLSVNFSARQLRQREIVKTVQDILDETGTKPSDLAIELTESLLMEQGGVVERRLRELAELGISLAIDDFGTGYSSLSYLKNFPVSTLKIDRSFIVDVTTNPDAAAITTAVIALARALDLEVVAEGVETRDQADFLRGKGCEKAQGYLLGRPAPVQMFTEYLHARQRRKGRIEDSGSRSQTVSGER